MRERNTTLLIFGLVIIMAQLWACSSDEPNPVGPKPVAKTNTMKIYMHYMPWFQSKEISGYWGNHWKMANKNPDIIGSDGKREIASHYYPLIGPYDSKDPDVIEYHLLLMKYAGVDAVLIDWYGSHTVNDYLVNLVATNAIIDKIDGVGIKFGVVYEDYTAEAVQNQTTKTAMEAAQADMQYLKNNYFNRDSYLRINDAPALLTFGPRYFKQGSQWAQLFSVFPKSPAFLPLWNHGSLTGDTDSGEFAWVDFDESLPELTSFYNKIPYYDALIGSAYPRFHDFYEEGGTGQSYGYIDYRGGETFRKTLSLALQRNAKHLQLVTWNDFGEGTVIEPTAENGFDSLLELQKFTGVSFTLSELQLIHQYFQKKKAHAKNTEAQEDFRKAFEHLAALDVEQARSILEKYE